MTRRHIKKIILALVLSAPTALMAQNVNDLDRSVRPGDDFYRYANGSWLKKATIPAGRESWETRAEITELTSQRVRDLIREAAGSHAAIGSLAQKVGDYYTSFMDENGIEARQWKPLTDDFAKISAISDRTSLSAYLGGTLSGEVDGLTANGDHVIGLWINQGFEDAEHNVVHMMQGGLGMPDRDDYLGPSPKMAESRANYQAHVAAILKLAGLADPAARAARIVALEVRLAQAFAPDSDATDVFKQNNPWKPRDFQAKAPGMDWKAYFKSAGLRDQADFVVWQPTAVIGVSALVASAGLDEWKDYLRFHLVEHYASVLPRAARDEDFAFYGVTLTGAQHVPDREQVAITETNGALGQAVGQLYTARYFSPETKAKAQAMVADLITAYHDRISGLSWMSAPTRQKALAKLGALEVLVGYPDTWIDYSGLDVVRGDAFGNLRRAEQFLRARNLAKLKKPVDPIEWPIHPQTPGAIIMFSPNAEFFSAALLQPPFFDGAGDAASNYGSAGAGIAHEISHSFDELGNIYDAKGRLGDWWTAEDRTGYHEAAAKLAAQFDRYCPFPDACVNGKQVLNENIADLAGLLVAHDAYVLSLHGKADAVINGLTGEQRFFVSFAQRWRKLQSEAGLRKQIASDTHAPGEFRSDTVRNVDEWYTAFGVSASDRLFVKPEGRVRIW